MERRRSYVTRPGRRDQCVSPRWCAGAPERVLRRQSSEINPACTLVRRFRRRIIRTPGRALRHSDADADTKVDVKTAVIAAGRLQALIDAGAGQPDVVDMRVKVNRIINAVRSMLPESLWPELLRRIDGDAPVDALHQQFGALDAGDEEFDPRQFAEMDDED